MKAIIKGDVKMFIITRDIEGARELSNKLSHSSYPNPYGWDQNWLKMCRADMLHIEWWKGEQSPVFGDVVGFYQTGTVEELHQQVVTYLKPEFDKKKTVLAAIKEHCPSLTLEVFESVYSYWARIFVETWGGSSAHPFDLLQNDIMDLAIGAENVMRTWKALKEEYPHLIFYPGSIDGMNCYLERKNDKWHVSVRGTNTQTYFAVPITTEAKVELERLEMEAAKPETFFCTECNCAQPMSEYAGFHFAKVLCKKHATPEWLKMARAENYE